MGISEFIANLEKLNCSLSVEDGKLHLKGDKDKLSNKEMQAIKSNAEIIGYIKKNKEALIEHITLFSGAAGVKKSTNISSIYKLSGLQQGMLFHGLYDEHTEVHKVQFKCDLLNVDAAIFTKSWDYVIKNHSILRSGYFYDSFSVPVQCVYNQVKLPVEILDLRSMTEEGRDEAIKNYEDADRLKAFDFKVAPPDAPGFVEVE